MTAALLTAWTYAGQGEEKKALATLDAIQDKSFSLFKDYHAALIADLSAQVGLELSGLSDATVARLRPAFPDFARPQNPLDGWGLGFNAKNFAPIIDALQADPDVGAIALCVDAPGNGEVEGSEPPPQAQRGLCRNRNRARAGFRSAISRDAAPVKALAASNLR